MGSLPDFLSQGLIIRLLVFVIGMMIIFSVYVAYLIQRAAEQRRINVPRPDEQSVKSVSFRRQVMGFFKNLFSDDDSEANNQAGDSADLPLPDLDFLRQPVDEVESEPVYQPPADVEPAVLQQPVSREETDTEWSDVPVASEPVRGDIVYVPGSGELPQDAVEVMRLWRDINDGALIIQLGDQLFRTIPELQDRGLARRFISIVQNLAQLATLGAASAGLPTPNFEVTSGIIQPPGAWAVQTETTQVIPSGSPVAPEPAMPQRIEQPLGIAKQIDRLLQTRLTQTPVFRGRKIQMDTYPDGSLKIKVDGNVYNGIGEIEDREVRQFIQQVVREWERTR